MKFNYSDIGEECTVREYVDQFETADPVLGGEYLINKGLWSESRIKIIAEPEGERVFLGVETKAPFGGKPGYYLFYNGGLFKGWRYDDSNRPCYRLQNT